MKLNKATRYGLYVLVELARRQGGSLSAAEFSRIYKAPATHVSKVLQTLSRAGLIAGRRGLNGGYRLLGDPRAITMMQVVELFEGMRQLEGCTVADAGECCTLVSICAIRQVLSEIEEQAVHTFRAVSIATLARNTFSEQRMATPAPGFVALRPAARS